MDRDDPTKGHMTIRLDDLYAAGVLVQALAAQWAALLLREGDGGKDRSPQVRAADQHMLFGTRDALHDVSHFGMGCHPPFHRLCLSRRSWHAVLRAMVDHIGWSAVTFRSLHRMLEPRPHFLGDHSGTVGCVSGVHEGPSGPGDEERFVVEGG